MLTDSRLVWSAIIAALASWVLALIGMLANNDIKIIALWSAAIFTAIAFILAFGMLPTSLKQIFVCLLLFGAGGGISSAGWSILPMPLVNRLAYLSGGGFVVIIGIMLARHWFKDKQT